MTVAHVRDEAASSTISSVFGIGVFLVFLLLSTQALVHLYATSTVTAVAFDAARGASAHGGVCPTSVQLRARLGRFGETLDVATCDRREGGSTRVTIAGPSPAAAFGNMAAALGLGREDAGLRIERSAVVRSEPGT